METGNYNVGLGPKTKVVQNNGCTVRKFGRNRDISGISRKRKGVKKINVSSYDSYVGNNVISRVFSILKDLKI